MGFFYCRQLLLLLISLLELAQAFYPHGGFHSNKVSVELNLSNRDNDALLSALFCPGSKSSKYNKFIPLTVAGIGTIDVKEIYIDDDGNLEDTGVTRQEQCLFLASSRDCERLAGSTTNNSSSFSALAVPIMNSDLLPLLEAAYENRPLTKTKCISLNRKLVNRDGGLFDELPWNSWGVTDFDTDAAGNPINAKFRFGKRDAFNRFYGKDWPSLSGRTIMKKNLSVVANLAARARYELDKNDTTTTDGCDDNDPPSSSFDIASLAERVLKLELSESYSELAELEQILALSNNNNNHNAGQELFSNDNDDNEDDVNEEIQFLKDQIRDLEEKLVNIESSSSSSTFLQSFLQRIIELATTTDDEENNIMQRHPYTCPFDLMNELIEDQLRANVLGVVVENTNLLNNGVEVVLTGGALLIERKETKKEIELYNERVEISVDDEEIQSGTLAIVNCDSEEAIGLALARGMNISVENNIWNDTNLNVKPSQVLPSNSRSILPYLLLEDGTLMTQIVRKRTKSSVVDKIGGNAIGNNDENMLSVAGNLDDYDQLSVEDKVRLLKSVSGIEARKLPRPRELEEAKRDNTTNPLDSLLIPFVDEAVRRQWKIREALSRGDYELARQLDDSKSRRQKTKEKLTMAETTEEKAKWEEEFDLLSSLRADVTQDEGSYSAYLDKDEWYERDRISRAKNLDKSKFGKLFEGL